MSLIVNGSAIDSRGLEVYSWVDPPGSSGLIIPQVKKGRKQTKEKVKACMIHTIFGKIGTVTKLPKSSIQAERMAIRQASGDREVSWHFTVDRDGTVIQSADPALWMCWHASSANGWSFGIEMVQDENGELNQACINATATLVEILCDVLSIPKIIPVDQNGKILEVYKPKFSGKSGSWSGVLGHRNQTTNRGKGDPGNQIFEELMKRGFQGQAA